MRVIAIHELHMHEPVASSQNWREAMHHLTSAIEAIRWPPGSDNFTINPTRMGNGVVPIREAFTEALAAYGWQGERASVENVGPVDAELVTDIGVFAVEWETGNISSSHRSLNRLTLGLWTKTLVGGILVLPSRNLYRYLTDRVGNFQEISPYLPLYRQIPLEGCALVVIEVEHDAEDPNVPLIRKGTDGWALIQRPTES